MRHLKASESIHDNLARDAAITEMGRRLAAQAIRARRRQSGHLTASREPGDDAVRAAGAAPLAFTREDAWGSAPPPPEPAPAPRTRRPARDIPWARHIATLRRVTLLGATAACGFSLVLYAENRRIGATQHKATPVAEAPPPLIEEALAPETLPEPPAEQVFAALSPLPPARLEGTLVPEDPTSAPPVFVVQPAQVSPPIAFASAPPRARRVAAPSHLLLARAPITPRPATPRLETQRLETQRLATPRLSPHVTLAKFEFPRWLTERHTAALAPRIMSEAPHDLALPKTSTATLAPVRPAPVRPAPVVTAPPAVQLAEPEPAPHPRPPRASYAYATPYPYPYPGYGAPYFYPYPLPQLRRPAFYTAQAPQAEPDQP